MPMVTIITPIYNSSKYVDGLIRTVQEQTFSDWEHIIIDDCSTDDTCLKLERVLNGINDGRFKLIKNNENVGPGMARNIGIENARGEYMAFLDVDDEWGRSKLDTQIRIMQQEGLLFTYHDYRHMSNDAVLIGYPVIGPDKLDFITHHKKRGVGCLTIMLHKSICHSKLFPNKYMDIIAEDFLAWASILKNGVIGYRIPFDLARYRLSNSSRSSGKIKAVKSVWFIYTKVEKIPFIKAAYYWVRYIISAWLIHKRAKPRFYLLKL